MTDNPELVEDVKQAFAKSSKEQWLRKVTDCLFTGTVKAEFALKSSNNTPWRELRKRGIVPSSMVVQDRESVLLYLTQVESSKTVKETVEVKDNCECCGQETVEEKTKERVELQTKAIDT